MRGIITLSLGVESAGRKETLMRLALRTLCTLAGGAVLAAAVYAQGPTTATTAAGSGPYPALMEADPGLTTHMVYRPRDLAALGERKLPIVVWGNGACVNAGNAFRTFLTEIASYGFLAVAVGPWGRARPPISRPPRTPFPPPAPRGQGAPALPPAATKARSSSTRSTGPSPRTAAGSRASGNRYLKVAAMGMSCGGLQATTWRTTRA